MDKELIKSSMLRKLKERYQQPESIAELSGMDMQRYRQTLEANMVISMLESAEDPFMAVFMAKEMNLCNDIFSQKAFWDEILSECCTAEEMQQLRSYRLLNTYFHMTEQERAQWMEEALVLLEEKYGTVVA